MINFDEVLTFSEAAQKWGLADGKSIRKAVERNRFEPYEIKKSGNVWLTTYDAMYRVFGEPRTSMGIIYFQDFFTNEDVKGLLETLFKDALHVLESNQMVRIVESREHPDKIISIIRTKEELAYWKRRVQYLGNVNQTIYW